MTGASRRWPVAPKVHASAGGAGAGALLLQLLVQLAHVKLGPALISDLIHLAAVALPALLAGWRAPHQNRPTRTARPVVGYRAGGQVYAPGDVTIIREQP